MNQKPETTVKETKRLRHDLNEKILAAIREFESATGMGVVSLDIERVGFHGIEYQAVVVRSRIELP